MRAFRSLLILALLGSAAVFAAGKKPTEFTAPNQMTEEELAEAKARSKNKLNGFDEKMEEKPRPFPIMLVGLVAISFIVATPFALRAFRGTSKEIAESTEALGAGREEAD